ncbi:MAG: methylenetetrahydrofolate--tRNA-(uracil(54)-C(5))-methyltransferase (FADH(2)-oxidizing) TrmFO [Oscillospiraceae bacterium]|nr:methylenetetrahydrofolate--tRNA-(uracil(54)-C(5))-methyltransferase (FADH(2)-oxidizing) TrmFO [Oscillospiraceae bacterium]
MTTVTIIGAGLAGCEAAWQLAERNVQIKLHEMKPHAMSPAHQSPYYAELVCSNSLRGDSLENAVGLLKEELRRMNSLIISCADVTRVPAGGALAVDREAFARLVTEKIQTHENITIIEGEVDTIPNDGRVIIASGPLTQGKLADDIAAKLGTPLFFFDAAAPIVTLESIDMTHAFWGSRYDKGTPDYVNCPLDKSQYQAFVQALATAEQAQLRDFEDSRVFEGCLPVEVLARRGEDALRYGAFKPVGLSGPDGEKHYAVLQLRKDNAAGDLLNLVGCQTHLTFGEQRRVFGMIPALRNAEYMRYGVMHRNTYIDSPRHLDACFRLKSEPRIAFAGQMTGVEGYVESCASGLVAALGIEFPETTAIGALAHYISNPAIVNFQPMNINFGLLPPLEQRIRDKRERYRTISERALRELYYEE